MSSARDLSAEYVPPVHINNGPIAHRPIPSFPFDAESSIRRLSEPAGILLVPYIGGLTIINDKIAAAINEHSGFREEPIKRILSTARAATKLVFGQREESLETAARLHHFHKSVQGESGDNSYSANDSELQIWVLASVFSGIEQARERWAKPLGTEREGLYQDVKTFGEVFGIDPSLMPDDVDGFDAYWNDTINSGALLQTDVSRELAQIVFRFDSLRAPRWFACLSRAVSMTSLDPRLQERADLRPNKQDIVLARRFDATMQQTYARIPEKARAKAVPSYFTLRRKLALVTTKLSASHD